MRAVHSWFSRVSICEVCFKNKSTRTHKYIVLMNAGIVKVFVVKLGWSGSAMVLVNCPINLDDSRARAYCACSWCGWVEWDCFGYFSRALFLFLSSSICDTARYKLKCCLQKQPTNEFVVVTLYMCMLFPTCSLCTERIK